MATKIRFDYSKIGLTKVDGITLFDGKGIVNLAKEVIDYLANYGLFVILTRALAGHEKDTDAEKKSIVSASFQWLLDGCPKRTKTHIDAKTATINVLKVQMETASKAEKAILAGIIAKMEKEV